MKRLLFLFLFIFFSGCIFETSETNGDVEIFFFNVSQGDAALIINGEENIMIDCGPDNRILNYLAMLSIDEIDYLIITHAHFDHYGMCEEIANRFVVKNIIYNGEKNNKKSYKKLLESKRDKLILVKSGDYIKIKNGEIKILRSANNFTESNLNSIVALLSLYEKKILFTADCEIECEKDFLGKIGNVDVLKVAHHGSSDSTSFELLEETKPKIAIISVGENSYNHPSETVLKKLKKVNSTILRTDLNGTIKIIINKNYLKFKIEKEFN